jgi:hypothetical protein
MMLFWDGKLVCFDQATRLEDVRDGTVDYRYRWWRAVRATDSDTSPCAMPSCDGG